MQKLELTWIGKNEEIKVEPRILLHDPSKDYGDKNTENILIHGDNLLALKALESKYAGQVKCIYIDPPYNTGSAFEHYDDNLEHSTWLSLMYERLLILKNLLAEDGFLCCEIDDSEGFYLKPMLDEIFGRNNYLSTFYIQVRYPNKTLAEDSDYQKVIEQIHIYSKNKSKAKLNRPQAEYDISKFKWEIEETAPGTTIELGGKTVTIFKPGEYSIKEVEPHLDGLKETWATGSLTRVKASAGEFFELHLAARKEIDGLGCLYKVSNIGEDGLGYRYISGPKKVTANKGKFYSGIPLKRKEELKEGKSYKYLPVTNFYDFSGSFGNCRLEGGVGFKGGKKPESLLKMIFQYFSNPGDLILDSFLGSGTSAAVALKMGRRFIGVELGEHCYSLCLPRLNRVIDGDKTGISKELNWTGGGGFKFFELAPSLVTKDEFGNSIIDQRYNPDMLAAAISLLNGYTYAPDPDVFWKQGYSTERSYIYTTTNFITREIADTLYDAVPEEINLLVCTSAFEQGLNDSYPNITFRKIPQSVLNKCTYGDVSYALPVIEREDFSEEEETFDD